MSIHSLIATAYLDLDASRKWVLAAIADSSDETTGIAAPGLAKLRAWSGLSKSRVLSIVKELEVDGYVRRTETVARVGQRATWEVFPAGVPAIPHPTEVAARFDVIHNGDNPESYPQDGPSEGPAGATLEGPVSGVEGPAGRTPSCITSYKGRASASGVAPRPVDNSRPSPPPARRTPFPGARYEPTAATDPRLAPNPGPPCPNHPTEHVPCHRCVHDAVNSDPATIAAARREARLAALAARHNATANPEPPEEPQP